MFNDCLKRGIKIAAVSIAALLLPCISVFAEGGINSNEARVLAVARGGFAYNNELYTAKQEYVDQLISYLSRDDVNLTESQADKAISAIYSNIETGVNEGYIVKQGSSEDNMDKDEKIDITEISPEEKRKGVTDISEVTKETPAPGAVLYDSNGTVNAYNNEGEVVVSLDGVMKNTGLNYKPVITALWLLSAVFAFTVIMSLGYIISERRRINGSQRTESV